MAALFVIAQNWKQPRSPSTGEWLSKPWYSHGILLSDKKGVKYQYMQ
jgi:hypothetical protein